MSSRLRVAGTLGVGVLLLVFMDLQAVDAVRTPFLKSCTLQAESEAAFVASALARRNDLLVVERFGALMKRDDLAYAVVCDASGRARFHTNVGEVGHVYDSPVAKRALAATATLVQELPALGLVEVDVPLAGVGILRAGFSTHALAEPVRWIWLGAAAAGLAALAAGLLTRGAA